MHDEREGSADREKEEERARGGAREDPRRHLSQEEFSRNLCGEETEREETGRIIPPRRIQSLL